MPYNHVPLEYHPAAIHATTSEMAANLDRFATRHQQAELEQLISRHESDKADSHRRILGTLIERNAATDHQKKSKVMLETATTVRTEEQKLLQTSPSSFANYPEVFIAELLDPTTPLPELEQGFLNHVLGLHLYAHPGNVSAQRRMRNLPAPLTLAYMGITNCWLYAHAAPAEQVDPSASFKYFMKATSA